MPRFVILTHDHPFIHWDLMLEEGETLRTWRLLAEPATAEPIPAEPLPAHRLRYLDYEGPVSGNRGSVEQWDAGTYDLLAFSAERWLVRLRGSRADATAEITTRSDGVTFRWLPDDSATSNP